MLLMLVTWACGCRVCWLAGCRVLWATWVISGGGGYLWVGWWHGTLVVEVVWDEERSHVTICDACDFGSTFGRASVIAQICSLHCVYGLVVSPLNVVVFAFWIDWWLPLLSYNLGLSLEDAIYNA